MRQGPNKQRGRNNGGGRPFNNGGGGGGNNNQRRSGVPSRNQNYDSSGPDVRIRGNAYQVYEKYLNLALDATSVGDRIMAESYYQHAEHYYRIINIIEYGPEDERRPDQQGDRQNNGQQSGHLYQPGFDGEGENGQGEVEGEGQSGQQPYDRNANAQRQGSDGQQQDEQNRFQQNQRTGNDRNHRFDNGQRRDHRQPAGNEAMQNETQDGQQPDYTPRQNHNDRQQRDYTPRHDTRSVMPQDEEAAAEMRTNYSSRDDDLSDEGPQALPDFIRRRDPRIAAAAVEPDQDETSQPD